MHDLETTSISQNRHGYEMADASGNVLGSFKDWSEVAEMFRDQDFSEEYIVKRKAEVDQNAISTIDETDD